MCNLGVLFELFQSKSVGKRSTMTALKIQQAFYDIFAEFGWN